MPSRAHIIRWLLIAAVVVGAALGPRWTGTVHAMNDVSYQAVLDGRGQGQPQENEATDPEANLPYLFAVYIITWAAFFGYVFVMARRRRVMQQELEALRRAMADRDRASAAGEQSSGET